MSNKIVDVPIDLLNAMLVESMPIGVIDFYLNKSPFKNDKTLIQIKAKYRLLSKKNKNPMSMKRAILEYINKYPNDDLSIDIIDKQKEMTSGTEVYNLPKETIIEEIGKILISNGLYETVTFLRLREELHDLIGPLLKQWFDEKGKEEYEVIVKEQIVDFQYDKTFEEAFNVNPFEINDDKNKAGEEIVKDMLTENEQFSNIPFEMKVEIAKGVLANLDEEYNNIKLKNKELFNDKEAIVRKYKELENTNKELIKRFDKNEKKILDLNSKINKKDSIIEENKNIIKKLDKTNKDMKLEIEKLNESISIQEKNNNLLKIDNKILLDKIENLKKQLKSNMNIMSNLKQENLNIKNQIKESENKKIHSQEIENKDLVINNDIEKIKTINNLESKIDIEEIDFDYYELLKNEPNY